MRFGVEVEMFPLEDALYVLERVRQAGLTTDEDFHPKHCECVPHERDHNYFHAQYDDGTTRGELVSRVLDSDNPEDWQLLRTLEQVLQQAFADLEKPGHPCWLPRAVPVQPLGIHVHVECGADRELPLIDLVSRWQDHLLGLVSEWLGEDADSYRLRTWEDEECGVTAWLRHPEDQLRVNPEAPFFCWLRFTELGTAELRWWMCWAHEPHIVQSVEMSLDLVHGALVQWNEVAQGLSC